MKIYISFVILLTLVTGSFAQKPAKVPVSTAQEFIVRKQQLVDDFELQLKDVPYAVVRIYIRYKLAEWLWKKGKDDTMRAEGLAIKALDEAYTRKDELANSHRFKLVTDIFGLLDTNAKETSARLKLKYDLDADGDLFSGFAQLQKKDGDQAVAKKMLMALAKPGDINNMINPLLSSLRTMRSPQFPIVLGAFLDAVETGRATANSGTLYMFLMHFNDPQVPPAYRARYFALVVARARAATLTPDPIVFPMLTSAIASFGEGSDLLPEAMGLKTALAVTETAVMRERREAQERIDASTDKIAALIEEAERTQVESLKPMFYMQAERLALMAGKLSLALDIVEKVRAIGKSDFTTSWSDQELSAIARKALEADQVEIAVTAMERIEKRLDAAEAWKGAATYFDGKKDKVGARDAVGRMLRLLADTLEKDDGLRIQALVRALPVIQKAEKLSMPEAIMITAKAMSDLPTPGIEDKPGTKNYTDYVFALMWVNYGLATATTILLSRDKAEAIDLAERINRKEFRVVADLVLATDALDSAQKEAEKKAAEKKAAAK